MRQSTLERIHAGDAKAVDDCLAQYSGLVWSLARRSTRSQSDAEDAVQEIFIEIWKNAGRFRPSESSEVTFIAMIARRRLVDRWRKTKSNPKAQSLEPMAPIQAKAEKDMLEISDEAARAINGLKQLRPEAQQVLELSIQEGLSYSQIASQLQIPLGSVKSLARRALIQLREYLGDSVESSSLRSET